MALCFIISIPECPPSNPFISTNKGCLLESILVYSAFSSDNAVTPPAQLTSKYPSSSESRFIMYWPFNTEP